MTDALTVGSDDALAMTHWPEDPNPAAPYLRDAANFAGGGIAGVMQGRGIDPPIKFPKWLQDLINNPDNQLVLPGMAKEWAGLLPKLRKLGLSYSQIAERLRAAYPDISRNAVAGAMRDSGLSEPKIGSVWDQPGLWEKVKTQGREGKSYYAIARDTGLSESTVRRALLRAGSGSREPGLPKLNLPFEEETDPKELAEFLKIFRAQE